MCCVTKTSSCFFVSQGFRIVDRYACNHLAQFTQPQHRARHSRAICQSLKPKLAVENALLQKRNVNYSYLQEQRQQHRTPKPLIRKQSDERTTLIRTHVEDGEERKKHQRSKSHCLRVTQVA